MSKESKKQITALTSACYHDWLLELDEQQFKSELQRFNHVSGGVLTSAHSLLILQKQLRIKNESENKAA